MSQPDAADSIPLTDAPPRLPPLPGPAPRWTLLHPAAEAVDTLVRELGISPLLATLLANRHQCDPQGARRFLYPSQSDLHDPFLMLGMEAAVTRLLAAIQGGETILIYGDYDVDGATAVIVLRAAIARLGGKTEFHIPHRITEGYGMREDVLDRAVERGIRLVVSVDTGIREGGVVEQANRMGMDCIITDHHLPETELPAALAILNPKQPGCPYPDKDLCGVGVAFKLAEALLRRANGGEADRKVVESFLKIVAIGTIADVVPLVGENRVFAHFGLQGLRRPAHPGLKALIAVAGLAGKAIGSGDVGFRLAPRLNAAGRMDTAQDVIRLFESGVGGDAGEIAERLNALNMERQQAQEAVITAIEQQLAEQPAMLDDPAWVFEGEGWHRGVVGIAAGRITEKYHRPVIVLSLDGDEAHGSARSISAFHMVEALDFLQGGGLFKRYGGHAVAAGMTLDRARVAELRAGFLARAQQLLTAADLAPQLRLDAAVRLSEVNDAMLDDLQKLAPHGMANPAPLLGARDLELVTPPRVFAGKHLSLNLRQDGVHYEAVFWQRADLAARLTRGSVVAVAFHPERTDFMGELRMRLVLRDLRIQLKSTA